MQATEELKAETADIAILSEGAYPFITGGVSAWAHDIIRSFPEYTFAVIFIGSKPQDYHGLQFKLPPNVVHLDIEYLFDEDKEIRTKRTRIKKKQAQYLLDMHEAFKADDPKLFIKEFKQHGFGLEGKHDATFGDFLFSKQSWDIIVNLYRNYCTDPSFIDYFWTVRNIHSPLWQIAKLVNRIPKVKMLHSLATGYAGFLGSMLKNKYHYPLLLCEHGIYTKERRIDLLQNRFFQDVSQLERINTDVSYLRNMWIRFFEVMSDTTYGFANHITSLYHAAEARQIADGADKDKTEVIANGVDIAELKKLRNKKTRQERLTICLLGRVVPIKDVKTLLRALAIIHQKIPEAKALIVGPTNEDPEYYEQCLSMMKELGLSDMVEFTGKKNKNEILPKVGVMVLSSISEGMPLVILEAYAAGIPFVATNVGACEEMILGTEKDDKAIGPSGIVVPIANPQALAKAIIEVISNDDRWEEYRAAAIKRVEKFYTKEEMIDKYRRIYQNLIQHKRI